MSGQKTELVEYIIECVNNKFKHKLPNKFIQRKLVRLIIDCQNEYAFNELTNGKQFIFTNIGKLEPVIINIGAKINGFTGKQVIPRVGTRIKYIPSMKIKTNLREKTNGVN